MKLRHIITLAISAIFLSACNMTLAADVTPPPNYVPPTPIPTLGPSYPASAPDIANGEVIYAEKCAPCHGITGLGDGEQGKQLPVTVIPIGLPETAQKASPLKWYTTVTQGNIDRFMPPFASLTEQERWDVVAYAFTLHTTEEQVEMGRSIFEQACADCDNVFSNQEMMSALSPDAIVRMIREGAGDVPAFGADLNDDEAYAVAAYVRTLTFAPPAALAVESPAETPVPAAAETPSAQETTEAEEQAETESEAEDVTTETAEEVEEVEEVDPVVETASAGTVSGLIENRTGRDLPPGLNITLRGYDHGMDPSAGPQEIVTLESEVNADGSYAFDDLEIFERQIFIAELEVDGLQYQSEFAVVPADATELTLPTIVVYATTEDFSDLQINSLQIFFDLASEGTAQVFAVYTITNVGDQTVLVNMGDGQNVPFLAFPEGASGLGYEATQDSAPFIPTATGFAMPPNDTPYGLIAFSSLPKTSEIDISQPALLPIGEVYLFLPEGVDATGATLTDNGIQAIQNTNFHVYTASAFNKGETLDFKLTGRPTNTAVAPNPLQNQTLLLGIGAFGIALVLAGAWMYMRDRNKVEEDEEEFEEEEESGQDEFEDSESIVDAIIVLDDLHRTGKLSDEAYKQRRAELKALLKRKTQ